MQLEELPGARCVIGLRYFDEQGQLLHQSQLCGTVESADAEQGIRVLLQGAADGEAAHFSLPPALQAWFRAPPGHYRDQEGRVDMRDPDYLVSWGIERARANAGEGQHQWWRWKAVSVAPSVGAGGRRG